MPSQIISQVVGTRQKLVLELDADGLRMQCDGGGIINLQGMGDEVISTIGGMIFLLGQSLNGQDGELKSQVEELQAAYRKVAGSLNRLFYSGPECPACHIPSESRSSADGVYAIWVCPQCRDLITT